MSESPQSRMEQRGTTPPSSPLWSPDLSDISPPLQEDLRLAAEAALAGGRAAMPFYRGNDLSIADPSGRGPVTAADRASHRAIVELLASERPQDPVLSEEGDPPQANQYGRLWVVDPLDGTREFIAQNGEFSVMVGLAVGGAAFLGAVYQPDPGRLYIGMVGGGAWRIDSGSADVRSETLRTRSPGPGALRLVRSRSHPDPRLSRIEASISPVEPIVSGSVGVKCALIAEGGADLYVHPVSHLREWDTCAPEAILRGAGGWVGDCLEDPLRYGKPEPVQPLGIFAACNETVRDHVAPMVRDVWSP